MAPTTEPTRTAIVERYVELNAMSRVLHVLVGNCGVPNAPDSPHSETTWPAPWADLVDEREPDPDGIGEALARAFPEDDPDENAEWRQAEHQSDLLAARLLAALVANSEYLARSAAWLLDGAAQALEEVGA